MYRIDIETSTFCISLNTGQFRAMLASIEKKILFLFYFLSFIIFEFLLSQNGNLFALTY